MSNRNNINAIIAEYAAMLINAGFDEAGEYLLDNDPQGIVYMNAYKELKESIPPEEYQKMKEVNQLMLVALREVRRNITEAVPNGFTDKEQLLEIFESNQLTTKAIEAAEKLREDF